MTKISTETARRVLDLELGENDAGAATVRDYLVALLTELWSQGENFGGKRPFGNSGWQDDIYVPMIRAGLATGSVDDAFGGIRDFYQHEADELIQAAIAELGVAA